MRSSIPGSLTRSACCLSFILYLCSISFSAFAFTIDIDASDKVDFGSARGTIDFRNAPDVFDKSALGIGEFAFHGSVDSENLAVHGLSLDGVSFREGQGSEPVVEALTVATVDPPGFDPPRDIEVVAGIGVTADRIEFNDSIQEVPSESVLDPFSLDSPSFPLGTVTLFDVNVNFLADGIVKKVVPLGDFSRTVEGFVDCVDHPVASCSVEVGLSKRLSIFTSVPSGLFLPDFDGRILENDLNGAIGGLVLVPEPRTMLLVGVGLAGLGFVARRDGLLGGGLRQALKRCRCCGKRPLAK